MDIPLLLIAAAYLTVLIGIVVVGSLNVYTAMKHGMRSPATTIMSIVFVFGVVVIICATAIVVSEADWSGSLTIGTPEVSLPGVGL